MFGSALAIIRVHGVKAKALCKYLLIRKTRIFKGALAHEFQSSVGPGDPHPAGKKFEKGLPNVGGIGRALPFARSGRNRLGTRRKKRAKPNGACSSSEMSELRGCMRKTGTNCA